MSGTSYLFVGEITENGAPVVQGTLAIYVTEYEISVRKHMETMFRGKKLSVAPFSPKMFWGEAVTFGYQLRMEGSNLGSYTNGPLGHPGDGEFEIYNVLRMSISGNYRKAGLDIEIEIKTGRGKEVCYIAKEEIKDKFQALNVTAKFLVPKDKLKEFLGFNENNIKYFMEKFDAIT
jgi:hypothetical protein